MNDRSGLSRGDRNRNARLARLRVLLPPEHAIVGPMDQADHEDDREREEPGAVERPDQGGAERHEE